MKKHVFEHDIYGGFMKLFSVIKVLFITILFSFVMIFILSLALYKFGLSSDKLKLGVMAIYGLSGFLGGFIAGKLAGEKKYLWGIVQGITYFGVLFLLSICVNKGFDMNMKNMLIQMSLCTGASMLGGMLS